MDLQRGGNIGLAGSNRAGNHLRRTAVHGSSVLDTGALGSSPVSNALHHLPGAHKALGTEVVPYFLSFTPCLILNKFRIKKAPKNDPRKHTKLHKSVSSWFVDSWNGSFATVTTVRHVAAYHHATGESIEIPT